MSLARATEDDVSSTTTTSEYESTISLPISQKQYESLCFDEASACKMTLSRVDDILYFKNDNSTRMVNGRMEQKLIKKDKRVCNFYMGQFYPIVRTVSLESLATLTNHSLFATAHKIRKIVNLQQQSEQQQQGENFNSDETTWRLSMSKLLVKDKTTFSLEIEQEYSEADAKNATQLYGYELEMMRVLHAIGVKIVLQPMETFQIYKCVPKRVKNWIKHDEVFDDTWIANKWNGIKGKLVVTEAGSRVYIAADCCQEYICRLSGNPELLAILENVCVQVELLQNFTILTGVIGIHVNNNIYHFETLSIVPFFDYAKQLYKQQMYLEDEPEFVLKYISVRPKRRAFCLQTFERCTHPSHIPENVLHPEIQDGFILLQRNKIIKWKCATLDVRCVGEKKYIAGDKIFDIDHVGKLNSIYEICEDFTVIRERLDRIFPATKKDVDEFVEIVKNKYAHASNECLG